MNAKLAALLDAARSIDALLAASLVTASVAAASLAYGLASAPTKPLDTLGPRGLRRRRALAEEAAFVVLEPLLRWAAARLSGLLPARLRRALDSRSARAGFPLGLTPEEYVVLLVAGAAGGALLGLLYARLCSGSQAAPVVGLVLGAYLVQARFDDRIATRARELTNGLPYVVDLLSLAMTAGLDFPGAVRHVLARSTKRHDALNSELEHVLQELSLGHTRRHALEQLALRAQVPAVTEMVSSVVQSELRGSPLVEMLGVQAQVSRQKRSTNAEQNAARAEHAMALPLVLLAASTILLMVAPMLIKVLAAFRSLG